MTMMAKSHHAAGACGGWRGGGWQRGELETRRPVRALRGWPVRARRGRLVRRSVKVHRWCSVRVRSGRGERARCSARACCAGWGRAAWEMRVGGPHGRGMFLRPCAPCNPARLMTQILSVVQPGSPCA